MKNLNLPKYTSYIRCINKATKEYIDLPVYPGSNSEERKEIFKNAGRWLVSPFDNEKTPQYDFYVLFHPHYDDEYKEQGIIGINLSKNKKHPIMTLSFNLETNEVDFSKEYLQIMNELHIENPYDFLTIDNIL